MLEPVPFRCLVPAEAAELFVGEDGMAVGRVAHASGANISVSDDGNTPPSLTDRIVTVRGTQQAQQAACRLIIERFYEAQKVQGEDIGVFILLVPSALATTMGSDGTLSKIMELSGAELAVQEAITGTEDRPVRIVGSFEATVLAATRLGAWVQVLTWRAAQASNDSAGPPENEEGCHVVAEDVPSMHQHGSGVPTAADSQPDPEQPDAEEPATGLLDTEPHPEQPDAEQPSTEQPNTEQQEAELPAAEQPEEEQPEAEQPSAQQLHSEMQGGEQPEEQLDEQPDVHPHAGLARQPEEQPDEEEPAEGEVAEPSETRLGELVQTAGPEEVSPRPDASSPDAEEISSPEPAAGSNFHSPSRRSSALPCRCLAPAHAVDLLIGFDGEGAAEVLQKTGAHISVLDEEDIPESLSDQIVVIEGDLQGQVLASRCVVETLFQVQGIGDKEQGLFVMLVPASHYGAVAEKVTALSEQTGADLVLEEEEIEGLEDHPLQIVGPVMEPS
ncbi:zmpB [Symbiodinium natans]|uniref:ZmpB protein n=1 Tax=Symbiodinium natans TaxID=878477 RepID=A0A812RD60_9DINO|nr:zmpB [Symbiodinium natans]